MIHSVFKIVLSVDVITTATVLVVACILSFVTDLGRYNGGQRVLVYNTIIEKTKRSGSLSQ